MNTQTFWSVIGEYNQKTIMIQMILLVFVIAAIVLSYTGKVKWAAKFALGIVNLFIGIGFFAWYGTEAIQKFFALPLYVIIGTLFLYESYHNRDDELEKPNGWQNLLLVLCVLYPLISYLLGNRFPQMVTYIMPCPVVALSIAVYAGYKRKNKLLLILLTIWGLTGVKSVIFKAYEDIILLVSGIYGIGLIVKTKKGNDGNMNGVMRELSNVVKEKYQEQSEEIINRAIEINQEICEENKAESKKVAMHTQVRIYPSIAFYKAIVEIIGDKEQAYVAIADSFNKNAEKMGAVIRTFCKLPLFYRLIPKIMNFSLHNVYGEESGFQMVEYPHEKGKCHVDMMVCPYFNNCKKYNCPEFASVFCNTDDISYGNMHPRLNWGRTKTLGRGDECCDFIIETRE